MSRTKKTSSSKRRDQGSLSEMGLSPETKRGIGVVFIFALSALMFLSFFGVAGSLGNILNQALSAFFGFDRFLVPVIFILIGATIAYPDRGTFSAFNYLGILFFFLSFNALLNLFLLNGESPLTQDLTTAGGYLGQFLGTLLPNMVGYWGSIVVVISLLFVAIMLTFNTSLRHLAGVHSHVTGWIGELFHLKRKDKFEREQSFEQLDETEEEEEVITLEEDEEEPEDEEEEEEETKPARRLVPPPVIEEHVLATRERRVMEIPMKLLKRSGMKATATDIDLNREIIEKTFKEFGIDVEMGLTSVGPTVTQFTMRPAQGIKLSRIVGLQNDLALALAAHPIRLEAPIPGKALVGIEVPNAKVATVSLRDVMESPSYEERKSPLTIPLGKDVTGSSWCIPLEKMPHMLVAGATGSGKSVALNTMIVSWLYQNGPDELKLILVDPKRVELTSYAGIPHLLVPPIINVDDTVNALKWTVREMERRLDMLSKLGARNIDQYNERVEERMPKLVLVIDELADLMSTNGREVEANIVRIAQMSRAVGIYLVLATQRPSVDVITGIIKANIPGRIAFAVASQTDSRTILDQAGAEKLLGRGDMLFTYAELAKPKRLQGAYISTEEVEEVVAYLKKQGAPDYNMAITEITKAGTVFDNGGDGGDDMLEEAIQVVIEGQKASTSYLQRRLRLGYARAARIMDLMEEIGVIGPGSGAKPREILVTEWPPGGKDTESIPTAERDYEEAERMEEPFIDEEEEILPEEDDETFEPTVRLDTHVEEDDIDDGWFTDSDKNKNDS